MRRNIFGSRMCLGILVLTLFVAIPRGWTATVTVGSTGTFATIADAVNDYGTWGNGSGDTISLDSTETHTITNKVNFTFGLSGDETFTLTSDSGAANAVILHATSADGAMRFGTAGTWNLTNLSFIPAMGVDFNGSERGTIQLEDGLVAPNVYTLNITGCIFSANNGSNMPNLTFGAAAPTPRPGVAIYHGDGSNPSGVNLNMTDCIIAHTYYAGMRFARNPDAMGMNGNAGPVTAVFDNCLWQRTGEDSVRIRNHNPGDSYTWQNCVMLDGQNGDGIQVAQGDENRTEGQGVFTIDNCIINQPGGNMIHFRQSFEGTIVINDSTIYYPDNGVGVRFTELDEVSAGGVRNLTITDTIFHMGDQAIRAESLFGTAEFTSVTISHMATPNTTPYGNDGTVDIASIVNAINADFSGAGPLDVDPQYVSTDVALVTTADTTQNDFLDIQDTAYATAASGGGPLEGGAQYVGAGAPTPTPTPPPSAVQNWELY
ncbi:MAG: hypothetical protein KC964_24950 [Candidatus Omnitrophica bacterium]|nr:hypothetical protein [Candidatus Omnitrophota bacterium]